MVDTHTLAYLSRHDQFDTIKVLKTRFIWQKRYQYD